MLTETFSSTAMKLLSSVMMEVVVLVVDDDVTTDLAGAGEMTRQESWSENNKTC